MVTADQERKVLEVFEALDITFTRVEHPPVYTVEEARLHWRDLSGTHCKNLFLRNKKGNRHFLIILEDSKRADLKAIARSMGEDRLSFASPERLTRYLGLEPGAVSPFGLINDLQKDVRVLLDKDLKDAHTIYFHPNVNTSTVGMSFPDFMRFLEHCGQALEFFTL